MNAKNRIVYVLLAVFLGFLGAHSYYTGNKIKALIQFVCGVSVILIGISFLWAVYDVFTVRTDVEDQPMTDPFPRLAFWIPMTVDFILPVCFLFIFIALHLIPAIWTSQEHADRMNCAANLNQLGMANQRYALDHVGRYPNMEHKKDFQTLQGYDKKINYFICQANTKQRYPYLFLGGYREPVSPKVPIAIERIGNHPGFVNVLFADGEVRSIPYTEKKYLQLAKFFHENVSKEEFEQIKRKLRLFDNPAPAKKTDAPKKEKQTIQK